MRFHKLFTVGLLLPAFALATPSSKWDKMGKAMTIKGYVLDSACAFTKGLKKPVSKDCAVACAKAGSPLAILGDDGTLYLPISDATPPTGQNEKLLPFAGEKVSVTGKVFASGGSHAIVIEKIQAAE